MKKLIALLLALALVMSLAACKDSKTNGKAPGVSADAPGDSGSGTSTDPTDSTEPDIKLEDLVPGEGVYTKVNYTVSDDELIAAKDTVVGTCGTAELDISMLNIYYWMGVYDYLNQYGSYLIYFGLDYTEPLDQQICSGTEGTWQHAFLDGAVNTWHGYQSLALMAEKEGITLTPELQKQLDELEQTLQEKAQENGFATVDELLRSQLGAAVTFEDYYAYSVVYNLGFVYFDQACDTAKEAITDADIEAYYTENEAALKENGYSKEDGSYYDVRHILIEPKGGTEDENGNVTYSEAEWEACRTEAQAVLDAWKAGEATEESFAALAKEKSTDPGSKDNGGLYSGLASDTNFVTPFKDWYLDESRQVGDTGLVKTDYGYHIMYFSGSEPIWYAQCQDALLNTEIQRIREEAAKEFPLTIEYDKVVLGEVDLAPNEE